jgi:hypothetical protein
VTVKVQLEERLQFRSWLHRHDLFFFYPYLLKQAAGEPIPLVLVCLVPCLSYICQKLSKLA